METKNTPWLSVLIPTYNGAAYLAQALESVRLQGGECASIECLVVDDGSTDRTLEILADYQKKIPLQILPAQKSRNWTASVNLMLKQARGKYVCMLHQDDLWLEGRLSRLRVAAALHSHAVLFLHPSYFINEEGERLGLWRCPLKENMNPIAPEEILPRLLVQNFISVPAPLFKREAALKKGMDEVLKYTADWDFWLSIAAQGKTVYLEEPLSCFRIHKEAQTMQYSADADYYLTQLEEVFRRHFEAWQAPEPFKLKVFEAGIFSIQANTALAAKIHGGPFRWDRLALEFLKLGPEGWRRYMRDSRIFERSFARLKLLRS